MADDPQPAAITPKRFCKDCRWVQGAPPHDLPLSPFCLHPNAVEVLVSPVTGETVRSRYHAAFFRRAPSPLPDGKTEPCGAEALYFEPQEAK